MVNRYRVGVEPNGFQLIAPPHSQASPVRKTCPPAFLGFLLALRIDFQELRVSGQPLLITVTTIFIMVD